MKSETIALIVLLGIGFYLYEKNKLPGGNVSVSPLVNTALFYKWYDSTIGDYNQDGSIPDQAKWFDYWYTQIYKGK